MAVEVQGGTWKGGKHSFGSGYDKDARKINDASIDGWLVLRFTASMLRTTKAQPESEALRTTLEALEVRRGSGQTLV